MCSLSLLVTRLLSQQTSRRFQHGFWHIEPLMLTFNGSLLAVLCFYAFVNAVKRMLDGARQLEFGWGMWYAAAIGIFCFFAFFRQRSLNRSIESEVIGLDTESWLMSACIGSAPSLVFSIAWILDGTRYRHMTPYIAPGVLALLTLVLIPMPVGTKIGAVNEVLLTTPQDPGRTLRELAQALTSDHYAFVSHSSGIKFRARSGPRLICHRLSPRIFAGALFWILNT
jgi:predicted Co/Zn/Cd cation transporter (cation efflux family)